MTKRTTNEMISEHREKLSGEFEKNKQVVKEVVPDASKKIRNIIAGYATRRVRSENTQ